MSLALTLIVFPRGPGSLTSTSYWCSMAVVLTPDALDRRALTAPGPPAVHPLQHPPLHLLRSRFRTPCSRRRLRVGHATPFCLPRPVVVEQAVGWWVVVSCREVAGPVAGRPARRRRSKGPFSELTVLSPTALP
jgi:hypothetical protein